MLVTCPNCQTVYDLPVSNGKPIKKIRCAACAHVWTPELPTEIDENIADFIDDDEVAIENNSAPDLSLPPDIAPQSDAESESESESDINLSAFNDIFQKPVEKPIFAAWIKPLYFSTMFFIAAAIYLFYFVAPAKPRLSLQTAGQEYVEEDYKTYLVLQLIAVNHTASEQKLSAFDVTFYNAKGIALTTTTVPSPLNKIEPQTSERLDLKIEQPPSAAVRAEAVLSKEK